MDTLRRRAALLALPLLALAPMACDDDDPAGPTDTITFETSFEDDAAGFVGDGTDLGNPPVTWSVGRTTSEAALGDASMRLTLDNVNDQAKIWIEREILDLAPNTTYVVDVTFDFGSSDWGTVNLWTLFVDLDATSPEVWADFADAFTDDTGNGATDDVGVLFEEKRVSVPAVTNDEGTLHLAIGVWGTFETVRDYYIDDLQVTATDA